MEREKGNFFDLKLFSKLMVFVNPYNKIYYFVLTSAILLAGFSSLTPYLLKITVDDYIRLMDYNGMVFMIGMMLVTLFSEVVFQFLFVYFANLLGQNVIQDLRVVLFRKIVGFKMAYFDRSSVGRLVTRAVNDIETIASIFSQGLFMIIADLLKMAVVAVIMLIINWELSLIVFSILPIILYATPHILNYITEVSSLLPTIPGREINLAKASSKVPSAKESILLHWQIKNLLL